MSAPIPLSQASDNPRKIPAVVFIVCPTQEEIESMARQHGGENLLAQLQELYSKYKFMEAQLVRSKAVLKSKFPDIQNALSMVEFLTEKEGPIRVDYQLADSIYAKAEVQRTGSANVMLEYPYDEAKELLQKNLTNAQLAIESTSEDLRFLKDQITTCEVNIARVYNYLVQLKQQSAARSGTR